MFQDGHVGKNHILVELTSGISEQQPAAGVSRSRQKIRFRQEIMVHRTAMRNERDEGMQTRQEIKALGW